MTIKLSQLKIVKLRSKNKRTLVFLFFLTVKKHQTLRNDYILRKNCSSNWDFFFEPCSLPQESSWAAYRAVFITHTVFPRIVVATTILFLGLRCDNYSRETTIQGRKLLFSRHSLGHLLWSTEASEVLELTHNHTLIPLPL